MRHNRRDDGQLSCRKREMKTMNANTALDGHTTVIKMAERGGDLKRAGSAVRSESTSTPGTYASMCMNTPDTHVKRGTTTTSTSDIDTSQSLMRLIDDAIRRCDYALCWPCYNRERITRLSEKKERHCRMRPNYDKTSTAKTTRSGAHCA